MCSKSNHDEDGSRKKLLSGCPCENKYGDALLPLDEAGTPGSRDGCDSGNTQWLSDLSILNLGQTQYSHKYKINKQLIAITVLILCLMVAITLKKDEPPPSHNVDNGSFTNGQGTTAAPCMSPRTQANISQTQGNHERQNGTTNDSSIGQEDAWEVEADCNASPPSYEDAVKMSQKCVL